MKKEIPIDKLLNFAIINLDKPSGPTSFKVSQFVKTGLKLKKTSHFGTLDPQVTGILPVALGRACRLNDYLMHADKEYIGIMRIHSDVSKTKLEKEMSAFLGKITQLPPIRSAVKRAPRIREIKIFKILEVKDRDVLFQSIVQAGTYIRKLCSDLGDKIGGAHMLELRRTRAGQFSEADSNFIDLYKFESALEAYKKGSETELRKILIPAEEAIKKSLTCIQISDKNIEQLMTGKPLMKSDLIDPLPAEEIFAAFVKDRLIGIYKKALVESSPDLVAKAEFVYN
tara:strand:+ start:2637 stop:3488 length:852 start_codon:yes stop_codon:yes gene_type:complete